MQLNDIACGFNKEIPRKALRPIAPSILTFATQYPELMHADAELSWMGTPENTVAGSSEAE